MTLEIRRAKILNKKCVVGDDLNGTDEVELDVVDEDDKDAGKAPWITFAFELHSAPSRGTQAGKAKATERSQFISQVD